MEIDARLRGPRLYESRKHAGLRPFRPITALCGLTGDADSQSAREVGAETPAHFEWKPHHVTRVKSL
eukprot:superscaffoldBa00008529_g23417